MFKNLTLLILSCATLFAGEEKNLDELLGLTDSRVTSVNVDGITVMHKDGVKRYYINNMPQELVEKYKLNSQENKETLRVQREKQIRHIKNVQNLKLLYYIKGEVLQVLPNGLLIHKATRFKFSEKKGDFEDEGIEITLFVEYSEEDKKLLYVDGSEFLGFVYLSGVYSYNNAFGVGKTIGNYKQPSKEFREWFFQQYPIK